MALTHPVASNATKKTKTCQPETAFSQAALLKAVDVARVVQTRFAIHSTVDLDTLSRCMLNAVST